MDARCGDDAGDGKKGDGAQDGRLAASDVATLDPDGACGGVGQEVGATDPGVAHGIVQVGGNRGGGCRDDGLVDGRYKAEQVKTRHNACQRVWARRGFFDGANRNGGVHVSFQGGLRCPRLEMAGGVGGFVV